MSHRLGTQPWQLLHGERSPNGPRVRLESEISLINYDGTEVYSNRREMALPCPRYYGVELSTPHRTTICRSIAGIFFVL